MKALRFAAGTPAARYQDWQRRQRAFMLARHLGRCANYAICAALLLMLLWVAAQIFVAFHSGRVRQILDDADQQSRMHAASIEEVR